MKKLTTNFLFDLLTIFSQYAKRVTLKKSLLLFLLFFSSSSLFSQDLIERTRLGIQTSNTNSIPNQLAKLVGNQVARQSDESSSLFEYKEQSQTRYGNFVSDAVQLRVNPEELTNLWTSKLSAFSLEIPVDEVNFIELELVQVDLYTEDFVVNTSDGRGLSHANQALFYRGIIKGDVESLVAVSIFEDDVRILIGDKDGNYVLGKTSNSDEHIFYNDRNLLASNPFECGVSDEFSALDKSVQEQVQRADTENLLSSCIPIYVECDFQTYLDHGSSVGAVNVYIGALINEVATLYANEQIPISLSQLKVWNTTDPYVNLNTAADVLFKFGEVIQNNYTGRLAHLISTRSLGGGVAWTDKLCANYEGGPQHIGPYALTANVSTSITPFPTYSRDVSVFAHEMGHNMGSGHTQDCSWNGNNTAIDGCFNNAGCSRPVPNCPTDKGTIMSWCDLLTDCGIVFANGFGPQPGALIRDKYNNASCTLTCNSGGSDFCPPTEAVSGTLNGSHTYQASQTITSGAIIASDANVEFIAGECITLLSGFETQPGGVFYAHIDECSSSSCSITDSLALVALYNATDGANWTNIWDLSQPIDTWYGIITNSDGCVRFINLAQNNLIGNISPALGTISNLESLRLNGNQLLGNIPVELGELSNLKTLRLSNNQLSGSIPSQLGMLTILESLSLGSNQLSGSIPPQLSALTNLNNLQLNQNQLSGNIPSELGDLTPNVIQLHSNQLSGCFPSELQSWCLATTRTFYGNANLPGGGDFDAFCSTNTGVCAFTGQTEETAFKVTTSNSHTIPSLELSIIPNPVNKEALIKYELPVSSQINLAIYDMQGKVMQVLHNKEELRAGVHQQLINASTLPSGIYFIRLGTETQNKTIKMTVTEN